MKNYDLSSNLYSKKHSTNLNAKHKPYFSTLVLIGLERNFFFHKDAIDLIESIRNKKNAEKRQT